MQLQLLGRKDGGMNLYGMNGTTIHTTQRVENPQSDTETTSCLCLHTHEPPYAGVPLVSAMPYESMCVYVYYMSVNRRH